MLRRLQRFRLRLQAVISSTIASAAPEFPRRSRCVVIRGVF
jgi:hypothetical protein